MKKLKVLLITVIFLCGVQIIHAQDKSKDKQKDEELQQAIDAQKKALTDQNKDLEEVNQNLQDLQDQNVQVQVETARHMGDAMKNMRIQRSPRAWSGDVPFIWNGPDNDEFSYAFGGDGQRTTWDFSKSVKENSFTKNYSFDVEKTTKTVVMSVMGDCKAGDIHVKIVMPNGKNYSDIVIDENGNLNWRKSFDISETENQDKTGEWKFQIISNKATGFFKISLQTF